MNPSDAAAPAPRVKICGIMRLDDALAAARSGADFLGYILYPKSPRDMNPGAVRQIVEEVRVQFPQIRHVGVMVNETAERAEQLVRAADLDYAQLHGAENPEIVAALRSRGVAVVKALRFGPNSPAVAWSAFDADYFLCDTFHPAAAGGTGQLFDHSLLPPDLPRNRMFLAGGLSPENVAAAVAALAPFAVDVSSGVEQSPGVKCHQRIAQFLREAKQG